MITRTTTIEVKFVVLSRKVTHNHTLTKAAKKGITRKIPRLNDFLLGIKERNGIISFPYLRFVVQIRTCKQSQRYGDEAKKNRKRSEWVISLKLHVHLLLFLKTRATFTASNVVLFTSQTHTSSFYQQVEVKLKGIKLLYLLFLNTHDNTDYLVYLKERERETARINTQQNSFVQFTKRRRKDMLWFYEVIIVGFIAHVYFI